EDGRVPGELVRRAVVVVQRVEVAARSRVLDDVGPRHVLDHHRPVAGANLQFHGHPSYWSTARSVCTPTMRAVTQSTPSWLRYSVTVSEKRSLLPRLPCFSQRSPGCLVTVSV